MYNELSSYKKFEILKILGKLKDKENINLNTLFILNNITFSLKINKR